jgi:ribose 5-phosphate isomerase B
MARSGNLNDIEIYIGSDHAGYDLKAELVDHIDETYHNGILIDVGCESKDPIDYPDISKLVSSKVNTLTGLNKFGILICGTGQGMCMTANKFPRVRACVAWNDEISKLSREHNDANVLCLPARHITFEMAKKAVDSFLQESFSSEKRHHRRVNKIKGYVL